jgi:dTDP-4-dehydrorhamnose 3,5-epimerase
MEYKIYKSNILSDITIIEPTVFHDFRGDIYSSYDDSLLSLLPKNMRFIHDKFVTSKEGVLRGMHGDNKTWKLISCVHGVVYAVVVDWRGIYPTFKKWESFVLSPINQKHILIPPGFLNGYYACKDSVYHYKLAYNGKYADVMDQITMKWDSLGIIWPCTNPILGERDKL